VRIGIGLPGTIPGTKGETIIAWARHADEGGVLSSLSTLDRIVYPNYEALTTLTAAAAVTTRVRLMTTILIATVRNTAILAKETASLDALSGGRLTLGLGVGGRVDDFRATETTFDDRGRCFDRQLETLHRIWSGGPAAEGAGPIGPAPVQPGGPQVLIGGYTPKALARLARWGAGYVGGGGSPERSKQGYEMAERVWKEAGRPGKPLFVGAGYFALGENAHERGGVYLRDYYSFLGPMGEMIAESLPATPEAVKGMIQAFVDAGADELVLWPTIAEVDQVDRLTDLVR
jgi:alkanesulfonate monooxygenase SsuD/methylene tetrahydromethanopterin reductase-like flavin-dependent oxidoreductase (luciferase family)